ncbi:MAG TPA: hypothetical protein VHH88_10455, partial [Verrucomicrobiae bacterium]|nr:hypothetical protein [Verrucomicrobiae bacterium]
MPYPLSSNRAFSRIASRAGASVFVTAGIIVARAFADPAFPTNIPSLSRIPPLRPPKPEIPPTFLEQHGVALWTGIGVFVAFCALLAFYLARPRRTLPVPPGVVARD